MDIPPAPLSIEVSITVEQIFEIVEMDYTFEVPLESSKPVSEGAKTVLLETLVWLAQAKFRLMLSWHDESIFRLCNGVDPWATPAACPEVWRPDVVFLNAKEIEMIGDSAEFWAMEPGWAGQMGIEGGIGASPSHCRCCGRHSPPLPRSPVATLRKWQNWLRFATGTAFLLARYSGVFTAPMGFQGFPLDTQQLPISL